MRALSVLTVFLGMTLISPAAAADPRPVEIVLADVSHALENRMLVVSGFVRNPGPAPVSRLIIDANGYGAGGDLVASGSDGIPWEVPAGAVERFSITLPLGRQLVREYVVQVSLERSARPLSSTRRSVDISLYHDHVMSLIRLAGEVQHGILTARADAAGLPVSQVTVLASLLVFDPVVEGFRLLPLTLDIAPERLATVFVGTPHVILLSLRVLDVRLRASWTD